MGTCLLIHGFTGSPFEVEPLAKRLHSRGHKVISPTLAGHCGPREEMERVTWLDWIRGVEEVMVDLLQQEDKIHLVGFSMGGLIAAHLCIKYPDRVQSLTLLSAPIYVINSKQLFKTIAEAIQKTMRQGGRQEDIMRYLAKAKGTPLRSLAHFRRLVQTIKPTLDQIEAPLLVAQGELDDLVEPRSAEYIHKVAKSQEKHLHVFPLSHHMICHDCEAERLGELVVQFIEDHEESRG